MSKQLSIVVTARSTGSRHEVFRLQADSSTWSRWTPFTEVTLIEQAPGAGEGVGAVKQTRFRGMTGRERIVSLTPDGHLSYGYIKGVFTPYIRDYVAVVDLHDADDGTTINWHSTFHARLSGIGMASTPQSRTVHPEMCRPSRFGRPAERPVGGRVSSDRFVLDVPSPCLSRNAHKFKTHFENQEPWARGGRR
jgi:hypothetical protein